MALNKHKDAHKPSTYHLFLKNAGTQHRWRAENENNLFKSFQKEQSDFRESWYIQYHYRLPLVKDYTMQPILSVSIEVNLPDGIFSFSLQHAVRFLSHL